jgi:3-methyladenine DNA glycosylase AlkD
LKEASKKNQKRVFDFVMSRKADMPRTALRYAIEKMPSDMKKKAMAR